MPGQGGINGARLRIFDPFFANLLALWEKIPLLKGTLHRSPRRCSLHDSEVRIDRKEFLHGPGMFFAEEITCKRI